jgi:hypothetical protein
VKARLLKETSYLIRSHQSAEALVEITDDVEHHTSSF